MQANPRTVELLNEVLTGELTAINQYFIHGKMCANWGYERLAEKIVNESIDEMKHADQVIERILFFEGVPNLQRMHSVKVGENVPEQFALDLEVEYVAIKRLNDAIAWCVEAGDNTTRALLESILVSEEEHIDWLETQLETIRQIGDANYLAQQVRS